MPAPLYGFNNQGVFTNVFDNNIDPPLTPESLNITNMTFTAPPAYDQQTQIPVWDGTVWNIEPYYTFVTLWYYDQTQVPVNLIQIGQMPADIDATDIPPPNTYSVFNPATQVWEDDPGLKYDYDLNQWANDLVGIVYNVSIPMEVYEDQVAASITPTIMTPTEYIEAAAYRATLNTLPPLASVPEPPTFLLNLPVRPVPS